jgi:hypothetical protein
VAKTPEEQAFWDAASIAAMAQWASHATAKAFRGHQIPTIAEFAACIANEMLDQRRKYQEAPNAAP